MPVKKTDTKITRNSSKTKVTAAPVAKRVKRQTVRKKTSTTGSLKVTRVPTKVVTRKIIGVQSKAHTVSLPATKADTRKRQTSAEMEQKLSILLATKERNNLESSVTLQTSKKQVAIHTKERASVKEVFTLPTNMSLRSIKKAEVIRGLFADDTVAAAQKVAYISSACLIAFGLFFSLTNESLLPQSQLALLGSSTAEVIDTTKTSTSAVAQPTLELTTAIPAEIVDDVQINLVAQNTSGVEVVITSFAENGAINKITANPIGDSVYRFTIPGKTLAPGEHRVGIRLQAIGRSGVVEKNFSFIKPRPLVKDRDVVQVAEATTATTSTSTMTTSSDLSAAEIIANSATTSAELQILLPQTTVKGITIVGFNAPEDTERITVFARNTSSLTPFRLGTASRSKLATHWQFVYDSRVRPDGTYELFAEAAVGSGAVLRDSVTITVSNVINVEQFNIKTPERTTVAETETEEDTMALPVPRLPREFVPVISSDGSVELSTTGDTTNAEAKQEAVSGLTQSLLQENRTVIEALYQRYSVALQSGDQMLLTAIQSDIDALHARLTTNLLTDASTNYYADDVDRELKEQFETMKKRIVAFEEIRKTSSNQKSAIDSDADGISDFDEENLYFTDPNRTDTDNDGVLDGIEVIRGFDPLNPIAEAIIAFESPKESFGLVRGDVLSVQEIVPIIVTDEAGETLPVQAEIRGKGLPNSFVTLFIFSTPIIITVKTDETGSFAYTFDKELENGEHEVYVAVTDNTGAIIAQSNPFRFVKEAEAFTPINNTTPLPDSSIEFDGSTGAPYNLTIGLGILALGLVLLMVGSSLRQKKEPRIEAKTV